MLCASGRSALAAGGSRTSCGFTLATRADEAVGAEQSRRLIDDDVVVEHDAEAVEQRRQRARGVRLREDDQPAAAPHPGLERVALRRLQVALRSGQDDQAGVRGNARRARQQAHVEAVALEGGRRLAAAAALVVVACVGFAMALHDVGTVAGRPATASSAAVSVSSFTMSTRSRRPADSSTTTL